MTRLHPFAPPCTRLHPICTRVQGHFAKGLLSRIIFCTLCTRHRPVSTIYNNIVGEGGAATDPSLDHFWRVLFGHFPETVVKFIEKTPTKSTSKMVPMANSLAFWRRAGATLYRVPSRHPGSQRMVFSRGARDGATRPPGSAPANEGPQLTCIRAL